MITVEIIDEVAVAILRRHQTLSGKFAIPHIALLPDEYTGVLQELQQQLDEQEATAKETLQLLQESGDDQEIREV